MINVLMILIVLGFLGGIILLNIKSPGKGKTREQFLKELAEFLEGTLDCVVEGSGETCRRIMFRYKDEDFIYEDHEEQGFKEKGFKGYLKAKTPSKLTLTLAEKMRSTRIKSDIFIASDISTFQANEYVPVATPNFLKEFKIYTNNPDEANKIFADRRILAVFKKFKNTDNRGYPFLSMRIVAGEVILEFSSMRGCYPNIFDLQEDVPSIDNCLDRLIVVIRKLKEISK